MSQQRAKGEGSEEQGDMEGNLLKMNVAARAKENEMGEELLSWDCNQAGSKQGRGASDVEME